MAKFSDDYEILPDGRVFSISHNWRGYGKREMRQTLNGHDYPSVRLTIGDKRVRMTVHGLVAKIYLPPKPSPDHEVRHLDGNKLNSHCANLAWGTAKENADDREKHGRTSKGKGHGDAVRKGRSNGFSDDEIGLILSMSASGVANRKIARDLGKTHGGVADVIRRSA